MAVTRIRGNENIQAGTLDKLKLEADFLNGGDLDLTNGNNNATITGLSVGVDSTSPATVAQLNSAISALSQAHLDSVKTIATGNLTLSGLQTVNGYTLTANDRIAVFSQSTVTEDGIYTADAGAWSLASDSALTTDIGGKTVTVEAGNNSDEIWLITNDTGSGVVGTDDITAQIGSTVFVPPTDVFNEEPTVTNGSAVVTLTQTPNAGTERVYLNGLRMREGGSNDYTIAGANVTFSFNLRTTPASQADSVVVDFQF